MAPVLERHGLTRESSTCSRRSAAVDTPFRLTPTTLSHGLMLSSGGMTKRLDRIAEAGLVQRIPDPDDRRGSFVQLTTTGRRVLEKVLVEAQARERSLVAGMSERDRRELARLPANLCEALERSDDIPTL